MKNERDAARMRRKKSIRKKISGTTERPRLNIFRSARHIYAQIVDDSEGVTLAAASTLSEELEGKGYTGNVAAARLVGALIAQKALEKNIKQVVFDRNGFLYHGRVKALADAAREAGLDF